MTSENEIRHEEEKKVPITLRGLKSSRALETLILAFGIAAISILFGQGDENFTKRICQRITNGENLGSGLNSLYYQGLRYDSLQEFCAKRGIDITQANTLQALRTTLENGGNVPSQLLWDLDALKSLEEIQEATEE